MRRFALVLIVALFAVPAGTVSAMAAPIDEVDPEQGGVTVTATVGTKSETITAGLKGGEEDKNAGLCASGNIHTSCTPADEAGGH